MKKNRVFNFLFEFYAIKGDVRGFAIFSSFPSRILSVIIIIANVIIADIVSVYLVYVFWTSDCRVFNFFLFEYWVLCARRIIFLEFSLSFLSRMLLLRILYQFIWLKSFGQAIIEFEYWVLCKENNIRGIFFILSFSNIIGFFGEMKKRE